MISCFLSKLVAILGSNPSNPQEKLEGYKAIGGLLVILGLSSNENIEVLNRIWCVTHKLSCCTGFTQVPAAFGQLSALLNLVYASLLWSTHTYFLEM